MTLHEAIRHGVTGFIASSVDEMVAAVGKIHTLSREKCRREFETRFTAEIMGDRYEHVYRQLIDASQRRPVGNPKAVQRQSALARGLGKTSEAGM